MHGPGRRIHDRFSRPQQPDLRIREKDLPLQSVRFHSDAIMPLALLVLPELLSWTGERLDARALSALGRSARYHDRDARSLVRGAERAQAHDGPARLRRWRKS